MNIYLISQDKNSDYDTYDSAVVAAESEQDAREIHPSSFVISVELGRWVGTYSGGPNVGRKYPTGDHEWVKFSDIDCVKVELLGATDRERGVILSSFNAG
jgi:hypothetical protein